MFNKLILLLIVKLIIYSNGQDSNDEECVCVPYYQCDEGKVITTGEGILNPRLKTCSGIEVCCTLPDNGTQTPGPITEKPPPIQPPTEQPITPTDLPIGEGPSIPTVSPGGGCGRRRFPGEPNRIDNSLRITGLLGYPEETFYGETPWMVRLLPVQNGQVNDTFLMCGGALITPTVVITAAHCVSRQNVEEIIVRAGDWNIKANYEPIVPQDRKVLKTILHPEFNSKNLANDIALLGLDLPFKLSQTVDVLCTPDIQNPINGSLCLATGWGKNDLSRYGTYQDTLRKVSLPLMDKDECQQKLRKTKLGKYFTLLPGFLCAGGIQDSDTCEGDGGGPLFCPLRTDPNRYAIAGVISWGIDCGKGNPAVFADVNHYMPWIRKQIS